MLLAQSQIRWWCCIGGQSLEWLKRWRLEISWNKSYKSWRNVVGMSLAPAVVIHKVPNSLPPSFDIFVPIIQTEMVLLTLEELSSRLQMDETSAGRKDHDAVEEALIVRIRSALRGRNWYAYSPQNSIERFILFSSWGKLAKGRVEKGRSDPSQVWWSKSCGEILLLKDFYNKMHITHIKGL